LRALTGSGRPQQNDAHDLLFELRLLQAE
jgi:hypothetical protein